MLCPFKKLCIVLLLVTELNAEQLEVMADLIANQAEAEMAEEPAAIVYDRADLEHLFTTLYCYSNLLISILDSNSSDHFRFMQFIKQVCIDIYVLRSLQLINIVALL